MQQCFVIYFKILTTLNRIVSTKWFRWRRRMETTIQDERKAINYLNEGRRTELNTTRKIKRSIRRVLFMLAHSVFMFHCVFFRLLLILFDQLLSRYFINFDWLLCFCVGISIKSQLFLVCSFGSIVDYINWVLVGGVFRNFGGLMYGREENYFVIRVLWVQRYIVSKHVSNKLNINNKREENH